MNALNKPGFLQNNKTFLMPKFRTMRSDTPQEPTHLLKNPDDYLLSIGRFLRKERMLTNKVEKLGHKIKNQIGK